MRTGVLFVVMAVCLVTDLQLHASEESIGPKGINSAGAAVNGAGVAIGQVEAGRPGKFDFDTQDVNSHVVVTDAFAQDREALADEGVDEHALWVASVLVSTQTAVAPTPPGRSPPLGVAPGAQLNSSAFIVNPITVLQQDAAIAAQTLAHRVYVINMSFGLELDESSNILDGTSTLTSFVDWSASAHEVLYVIAGNELKVVQIPVPTDNYNGITVASSLKADDGVYRKVSTDNVFNDTVDAGGDRTSTDILAPGHLMDVAGANGTQPPRGVSTGTSFAAPHVTGTVALLQQLATTVNGHRHQVMKAVVMNSADKIKGILGMERTVLKTDGSTWPITAITTLPLDRQMGVGHLNGSRAIQQFSAGEHGQGGIPNIGWDYNLADDPFIPNAYIFNLNKGDFLSATLAWDREVLLNSVSTDYERGDTFINTFFEDLNLYLVHTGDSLENAIASSTSTEWNLEHIFFPVPSAGSYTLFVKLEGQGFVNVNYAIAWWAGADARAAGGDYSGDGSVGPEDYGIWQSNLGSMGDAGTGADGNGNGTIDAADYVVWRNSLTAGSGTSFPSVPEPSIALLVGLAVILTTPSRFPATRRPNKKTG